MKSIAQEVSLNGRFEMITIGDLRKNPGEVLASVDLGKTFLVTKSGRPIAVLSKPPGETLSMEVRGDGSVHYRVESQ